MLAQRAIPFERQCEESCMSQLIALATRMMKYVRSTSLSITRR